jgi:hypothetical protein
MPLTFYVSGSGRPEECSWRVMRFSSEAEPRIEVEADGLSQLEAEILCGMRINDLPRGGALTEEAPPEEPTPPRRPRQLAFKF